MEKHKFNTIWAPKWDVIHFRRANIHQQNSNTLEPRALRTKIWS